jgi:hypothetical protein
MKKSSLITLILLSFTGFVNAQFVFNKIHNIPVADTNGVQYKFPWVGGFNNPQYSAADINNDGIKDLVIFNRSNNFNGDRVLTFINNGTAGIVDYEYAPEYEKNFPYMETDSPRIEYWMLMVDYNCDGIEDIFFSTPGYIQLYEASYDNNNMIRFTYKTFLQFNSFSGLLNIFVSSVDLPAITDMNGDGDIDVLVFNIFGYVMEYYENQSIELTGTCGDTIVYELVDDCWGNVFESGLRKAVDIKDTCGTLIVPKNTRHPGGSTILAFDVDADGDKDVLIAGGTYPNMNMLYNGGNADTSLIIAQDTLFPVYDIAITMNSFPSAFYLDVNNDGREDLIVAPNNPKRSQNYYCSYFYENISSSIQDSFSLVNRAFMVEDMIDVGEGAYPVFVDFNQDSLIDFVLGNYGYYTNGITYKSGLALFQNVGTAQFPEFKLITRDGYNLSALNLTALAPAFADMDNDGALDMILGEESGEIHYFTNTAGAGNPFNFTLTEPSYKAIDIGQYSTPVLFDVDDDGLLDLVIGERSGNLNYFKNIGTDTLPDFDRNPTNSFFGKVDVVDRSGFQITGFSAPVFSTLDSTGKMYLLVGSESGGIKVYDFDRDSIDAGGFTKLFDRYSNIHEGERNTPTIADLNNDGKMEMLVGTYRGGLSFFTQSDSIAEPISAGVISLENFDFMLYPNPASTAIYLRLKGNYSGNLLINMFDLAGRNLLSKQFPDVVNGATFQFSVEELMSGMYFIEIKTEKYTANKKLMVR